MTDTQPYISAMTNWQRKQWHAKGCPTDEARLVAIIAAQRDGTVLPIASVKADVERRIDIALRADAAIAERKAQQQSQRRMRFRGGSPPPTAHNDQGHFWRMLAAAALASGPKIVRRGVR